MFRKCFNSLIILLLLYQTTFGAKNYNVLTSAANYGPYELTYSEAGICRGPKSINLTTFTVDVDNVDNTPKLYLNFTFPKDAKIAELRINVSADKANPMNLLWSYNMRNPCQHFFISILVERFLKSKDCLVKKGNYAFNMDYNEIARTFLGPSFFYGNLVFKVRAVSQKENIICLIFNTLFKKKV